jgi:serine/threonine-protein kinase
LPIGDGPFRAALKAELIAIELEWRRRRDGLRPPADRAGDTADRRPPGRGVLETLSASVGAVPHVLLRDTDGAPEPPLHRPGAGEPGQGTRYRIDGEIARCGMGAVLKGRDPDLGRDVALKVLREDFRDDADMVRRFIEEAQLQHPGLVPMCRRAS